MRKLIVLCCAWVLSCSFAFASSTPATLIKVLDIQHWKTSNGASVYFVKAPELPMLDVRVDFTAGSAYDDKTYGLASLTNDLIGQGAKGLSADDIAQQFDDIGARFGSNVGRDKATVYLRTLSNPKYLSKAIKTFAQVLAEPTFTEKAIRRSKNRAIAAIKVGQQNPGTVASKAFYERVFKDQPYGHPVLGTLSSVGPITREEIKDFYQRFYVANNANVILVGNITRAQAETIADILVGRLPSGKKAPTLQNAPQVSQKQTVHIDFPSKQTSIVIGQVGITRNNPHYYALTVGNHILGGLPLNSMLYNSVRRQRGLAYYAYSNFNPLSYRGPFTIALKTKADQTQEAVNVVENTLSDFMQKGADQAQLELAKKNLVGSFPLALSTNGNILRVVSNIAFYHRPLDYLDHYRDNVNKVTLQAIKKAFAEQVKLNNMVIVTVGPKKPSNEQ